MLRISSRNHLPLFLCAHDGYLPPAVPARIEQHISSRVFRSRPNWVLHVCFRPAVRAIPSHRTEFRVNFIAPGRNLGYHDRLPTATGIFPEHLPTSPPAVSSTSGLRLLPVMAPARRRAAAKSGAAAKETEIAASETTTRTSRQGGSGRGQKRTQKGRGRGHVERGVEAEEEVGDERERTEEAEAAEEAEEAEAEEVDAATGQPDSPVVQLSFNEPLSWRPGKPIPTEELIRRLDALSRELSDLDQETFDAESLTKVSKELANHNLLNHKDKGVKAFAATCLVDILCLCAPNAPFTQTQLQV